MYITIIFTRQLINITLTIHSDHTSSVATLLVEYNSLATVNTRNTVIFSEILCSHKLSYSAFQLQRSCYHSVHTIIAQLIYIHLHHEIQPSCNYNRTIGILLINFLATSRTLADTRSSDSYNRLATSRTLLTPRNTVEYRDIPHAYSVHTTLLQLLTPQLSHTFNNHTTLLQSQRSCQHIHLHNSLATVNTAKLK